MAWERRSGLDWTSIEPLLFLDCSSTGGGLFSFPYAVAPAIGPNRPGRGHCLETSPPRSPSRLSAATRAEKIREPSNGIWYRFLSNLRHCFSFSRYSSVRSLSPRTGGGMSPRKVYRSFLLAPALKGAQL